MNVSIETYMYDIVAKLDKCRLSQPPITMVCLRQRRIVSIMVTTITGNLTVSYVKQLVQATDKENIRAPYYCQYLFVRAIHLCAVETHKEGLIIQKHFHVTMYLNYDVDKDPSLLTYHKFVCFES